MSFDIHSHKHTVPESHRPPHFSEYRGPYSYPSYPVSPSLRSPEVRKKKTKKKWIFGILFFVLMVGFTGFVLSPWLIRWKDRILVGGTTGAVQLERALGELAQSDVEASRRSFRAAIESFTSAEQELSGWGSLIESLRFVPGLSKPASGKNLLEAGTHLARAGERLNAVAVLFLTSAPDKLKKENPVLLDLLVAADPHLERVKEELEKAKQAISVVRLGDVPEEKREAFEELQTKLPVAITFLEKYLEYTPLFEELLGANGPRKYLFLFQNNHELRATGGFIGSYARLDMTDGKIRQFFIDGIFNPDGQLKENIVPPQPIQKISAGWSLHDSNWFPDFPVSAEKAIFFYEKTGGPTVDGVITITPTILGRLLELTGPITLPEYGVTISSENFIPVVQEEVEAKYDREENQPKKILADLSSAIFERLLLAPNMERFQAVAEAFVTGLNERHILLYSRHRETQALIDAAGWSGRILTTPHDYLAVIHSNINGFKTDGVIDDKIEHTAEIQSDGSIIDTVSITRRHRGGSTPYAWWNKVNANYMRVYVPLGSELLSADGMTREFPPAPLDYDELGFRRDETVTDEEGAIVIDEKSGTRVGVDAGKTVFGNWVYVSPQESVTVTYRYRLPSKIALSKLRSGFPLSHSMLYQKQAGTSGVIFSGKLILPAILEPVWQTGENLLRYGRILEYSGTLDRNQFYGWVFGLPESFLFEQKEKK